MSFERYSELHNIHYQTSVNAYVQRHSRSGDSMSNGSEKLDFYICSPSPEDVLISKVEYDFNSSAISRALKITKQYIKSVFSPIEVEFIKGLITSDRTPAKIAEALGENYYNLSKTIYSKFETTKNILLRRFYNSGYYCKKSLEFIPRLFAYIKHNEHNRLWVKENSERRKETKREWYLKYGYKKLTGEEIIARKNAKRKAKLATLPEDKREKQIKTLEYMDEYYSKKKRSLS